MKSLITVFLFLTINAYAQSNDCSGSCQIVWEQEFHFPAIAQTFERGVGITANEAFVHAVSGSGMVRELIVFLSDGTKRYLTDATNKVMGAGGNGVVVDLGRNLYITHMMARGDSWGGTGSTVTIHIQLRNRGSSQPTNYPVVIFPGQEISVPPSNITTRVRCDRE